MSLAGCGGDDEQSSGPATPEEMPAATAPQPVTAPPPETTIQPEQRDPDAEPRTVPEEGQAGDEEAIRSEAVFTGKGGKLTPREIKVPAFIAIRVILRSTDGAAYTLEIGGKRLKIGEGQETAEAELDGLLPNERYDGSSPQGDVRVSATAEPGP